MGFARISDQTLLTVNTIELAGIFYLAVVLAKLHERVARIEGRIEEWRHDKRDDPRDHSNERGRWP